MQDNPFKKLHIHIHAPKQLPRIIPEHTVRYILQDAYDTYTPGRRETLRDILVLELLFSTGLRVSELCELTRHTFQLGEDRLRLLVYGKGRKARVIEISTYELISIARKYCDVYSEENKATGKILINQRNCPLTPQSVRRIIDRHTQRTCENCHITPHMFRHTFATIFDTFQQRNWLLFAVSSRIFSPIFCDQAIGRTPAFRDSPYFTNISYRHFRTIQIFCTCYNAITCKAGNESQNREDIIMYGIRILACSQLP